MSMQSYFHGRLIARLGDLGQKPRKKFHFWPKISATNSAKFQFQTMLSETTFSEIEIWPNFTKSSKIEYSTYKKMGYRELKGHYELHLKQI